jgi:O-antigen/teichoic acid export membrane protein
LLAVAFPLVLTQALSYVTGQADVWIAGATIEHADLALYGAARRLMLLIGMPMQLVNLTVVASIAELRAQGRLPELQKILRSAATMAAVPAVLVWLPLAVFPEQILALLFGEFYGQSATILRILCIGQVIFVFVGAAELTLMMSGNQRSALAVNCITSVLLLCCGMFLTQRFGAVGLAIAWSTVVSLQCILFSLMARKMIRVWTICDVRLLLKFPELLTTVKAKLGKSA